jgi:putative restriction endonuclease
MAKGVLLYREGSKYVDEPELRYQFPKMYLNTARTFIGDWVVYNELLAGKGTGGYRRIGKVYDVVEDLGAPGMYVALIEPGSYFEFENFVPYRDGTQFLESRLVTGTNKPSQLVRVSVREIPDQDFFRICHRGNPLNDFELPRFDSDDPTPEMPGMKEAPEKFYFDEDEFEIERKRFELLVSKPIRSRVFRDRVIRAYRKTCAFTGMSLVNGNGRPEVQAAHIQSVEAGGPDRPDNGIALSGTVHWMFDRGLISLSDKHEILVSRQANDPDQIWRLMVPDRKAIVPDEPRLRPNPRFLNWHRSECFKH